MTYVVFDIGGTKTRVAVSSDLEKLDKNVSFSTPNDFEKGVKKIAEAVAEMTDKKPKAIAGGIRGPLNEDKTGILHDGVLTKWGGKSVADELIAYFDVPVTLENDAAIAGVGEAVYGAGKGMEIVAFHTVSTGVGGVKIENGQIDLASVGFEPGHQVLDIDRTILGEEITPTLENLVSGNAVEERFGVKPYEIPQTDVLWEELAEYLAQGLRNTILYWSPDAIVLGGSMITGDPRIEIDAIRKYTVEALDGFVEAPLITMAKLGDEAGLYGAMGLLKQAK
ncbi:MAG: ROK family protein [Candidatus Kaiserbacteria bacterium]|nr:ROK family protein [Candidatus Kaiserbacteria bacterium]MCB9816071.1 ROK family protein [Candidatus Nomurabacteria bacterium]